MAKPLDMGESLVGAYLRYVTKCDFVVYGTQTERQGEIDVIGFQVEQRKVWICEVATHLDGLLYGSGGNPGTIVKVKQKVRRAVLFAERLFPDQEVCFEWWSPKTGPTLVTGTEEIRKQFDGRNIEIAFITNDVYAERVKALFELAQRGTKATPEPFYRSLQILTHLAGKPVQWE